VGEEGVEVDERCVVELVCHIPTGPTLAWHQAL
jgi:hypothetical protein